MNKHKMHPYAQAAQDSNPGDADMREKEISHQPAQKEMAEAAPPEDAAAAPEPTPEEMARSEVDDMRLRMAAEMDNFKKRLTRDHQEQVRFAAEKVLGDLLPALDNLDLAIQYGNTHEACRDMMQGIEMTRRQLLDAVAKSGLVSMGERGEAFDPAVHEAVGVEAAPDLEPGAVSRVLQRGYKLHDRLLRPAKVMVNN